MYIPNTQLMSVNQIGHNDIYSDKSYLIYA